MVRQKAIRWPGRLRAVALLVLLLAMPGPGNVLRADDLAQANATAPITATARLEYQETDYRVINWSASITVQSAPFPKEPASASGKIIRGVLNFGGEASNSIPFLWQRDAGKLFLDLNRNRDLTDDAAGTFSAYLTRPLSYQTFTNVHLRSDTPSGPYPMLADLRFWDYGSRPGCTLELRSFWQGRVTLAGQDWQVGVIPDGLGVAAAMDKGHLLLRPWDRRNQAFNTADGSLEAFRFAQKLFIGGHAYQVSQVPGTWNGETKPALKFMEQTVALGELKIAGQYIQRLMLPGGPYLVILDRPGDTVQIPVGSYNQPNLLLAHGGATAFCNSGQWQTGKRVSVDGKAPAILAAGGPLRNSVAASRHGRDLRLDYRLLGAGDATYELAAANRSEPPEVAIYKGDKKVASGKFAFG